MYDTDENEKEPCPECACPACFDGELSESGMLDTKGLDRVTRFASLEETTYADVETAFRESGAGDFRPSPSVKHDPRSGIRISYSEARRSRPLSREKAAEKGGTAVPEDGREAPEDGREALGCIVCEGRLTPVIDRAPLSEGETFINPNLFPLVYPFKENNGRNLGMHFLQWCSTLHDVDIHNMFPKDLEAVLRRLAVLEEFLLHGGAKSFPESGGGHRGYAVIMKNRGFKVGGSVEHGHQQIAHVSHMPRSIAADSDFLEREGKTYASHIRWAAGAAGLTAAEYPGNVSAVIPPAMRRPLEAAIIPPDGGGEYLHHLEEEVLIGLARALREMTGALYLLMTSRNLTFDYNLAFHTGPLGLLYIEILPWTQPYGGFEHLGHFLCQEEPETTARCYREVLGFE